MTVVEARDRIGGRVHTVRIGRSNVDLGASWIHGLGDNPLTDLVERAGSAISPTRSMAVRRVDGSLVEEADIDAAFCVVEAVVAATSSASTGSLASHFDAAIAALDPEVATVARAVVASEVAQSEGADLDEASIECLHELHAANGDEALVGDGLGPAIGQLARGLDVRLGWRAREILVDDHGVVVLDDRGRRLRGDHCVVTAPLGVLRADHLQITPPLPGALRSAIARLGIGRLEKVALRFAHRFWDDTDLILLAGTGFDVIVWTNLERVTGEPVLVGFVAGRAAEALADASDAEVRRTALQSLDAMYG